MGTVGPDRGAGRPMGSGDGGGIPLRAAEPPLGARWMEGSCLLSHVLLFPSLGFSLAEGEVYSWGKGARGRLGRRDEDAGLPRPVQLQETHPYTVTSVSCCHGNTLLAVRSELLPFPASPPQSLIQWWGPCPPSHPPVVTAQSTKSMLSLQINESRSCWVRQLPAW